MSEQNAKTETMRVCGLWLNESKAGRKFLSGNLGFCRVLIFPARERQGEKSPTHYLCLAPLPPKNDHAKRNGAPQEAKSAGPRPAGERLEITDDDLPF